MSALFYRPCIVVFRHDVTRKSRGVSKRRRGRRYRNRSQIAGPLIGQVTVLVREHAEPLPADAQIERQLAVHFPIILEKRILVFQQVTVNDAVNTAAHAEQTRVEAAQGVTGRIAGIGGSARSVRRCAAGAADQEIREGVHTQVAAS